MWESCLREIRACAPVRCRQVANWGYLDATLERTWDEILSTTKARRFGFHEWEDSEARLLDARSAEYRAARDPALRAPA